MTDVDRTEGAEDPPYPYANPLIPIPDHLKPYVAEWLGEAMQQACEDACLGDWTEEKREEAAEVFRLWHAMHGRVPLSPQDVIQLADKAGRWQDIVWPTTVEEVAACLIRLTKTGELYEVRDRARAFVVQEQRRSRKPTRSRLAKD